MLGRIAAYGAAVAIMLPAVLFPSHSSARGFAAAPAHHAGSFPWHFGQRAFRPQHRGYGRHGNGYAYLPLGFEYGNDVPAPEFVPLAYPVYLGPRCLHSVETVIVPAELGGERRIRITRC